MSESEALKPCEALAERVFHHAFSIGWRCNQLGRSSAPVAVEGEWQHYVGDGALRKSLEATLPLPTAIAGEDAARAMESAGYARGFASLFRAFLNGEIWGEAGSEVAARQMDTIRDLLLSFAQQAQLAQGPSRATIASAIADGFTGGNEQYDEATLDQRDRYDMAADAVLAQLAQVRVEDAKPVAYMRRYVFDGTGVGTKGNRPKSYKFHDVTKIKIFDDDVPLYAALASTARESQTQEKQDAL